MAENDYISFNTTTSTTSFDIGKEPLSIPTYAIVLNKNGLYEAKTTYTDPKTGKVITTKIPYQASYKDVMDAFNAYIKSIQPPSNIPVILPRNCRYYESNEKTQSFLVEIPPNVFDIKYLDSIEAVFDGTYDPENRADYEELLESRIATPWQYLWAVFKKAAKNEYNITHTMVDSYLFWAPERLTSLTSLVYPAKLPNIYQRDGKICLGETSPRSDIPITDRVESIITDFYESVFNADLPIEIPYGSFNSWSIKSDNDPYCWMGWNFNPLPLNNWIPIGAKNKQNDIPIDIWNILYQLIQGNSRIDR